MTGMTNQFTRLRRANATTLPPSRTYTGPSPNQSSVPTDSVTGDATTWPTTSPTHSATSDTQSAPAQRPHDMLLGMADMRPRGMPPR